MLREEECNIWKIYRKADDILQRLLINSHRKMPVF
jgi:hypothetical protein